MTLTLRTMKKHMGWEDTKDDYAVLDGEKSVGRIYKEHGEGRWFWSVSTSLYPAPPPNNGLAESLEEAKQQFKQRYEEMKAKGGEALRLTKVGDFVFTTDHLPIAINLVAGTLNSAAFSIAVASSGASTAQVGWLCLGGGQAYSNVIKSGIVGIYLGWLRPRGRAVAATCIRRDVLTVP
jgi:hypothetical protein